MNLHKQKVKRRRRRRRRKRRKKRTRRRTRRRRRLSFSCCFGGIRARGVRDVVSLGVCSAAQRFTTTELHFLVHCNEGGDHCGCSFLSPSPPPPLPTPSSYFFWDSVTVRERLEILRISYVKVVTRILRLFSVVSHMVESAQSLLRLLVLPVLFALQTKTLFPCAPRAWQAPSGVWVA